jgi:hypothetical protein
MMSQASAAMMLRRSFAMRAIASSGFTWPDAGPVSEPLAGAYDAAHVGHACLEIGRTCECCGRTIITRIHWQWLAVYRCCCAGKFDLIRLLRWLHHHFEKSVIIHCRANLSPCRTSRVDVGKIPLEEGDSSWRAHRTDGAVPSNVIVRMPLIRMLKARVSRSLLWPRREFEHQLIPADVTDRRYGYGHNQQER